MKKIICKSICKYFILVELIFMLVGCGSAYECYEATDPMEFPADSKSYINAMLFRLVKPFKGIDGNKQYVIHLKLEGKGEVISINYIRSGNKYDVCEWIENPKIYKRYYSHGKLSYVYDLGVIKHINIIDDETLELVYNDNLYDEMSLRFYKKGKKRVRTPRDL